ncbi:MAG: oxidoreductase molybdopterin binding protein [Actinobacteria bacterium]|nr:oxidoreductase molybdopterin binding protein [Actinomycetota bacterium]
MTGTSGRSATKTVSDTENVADLTGVHSERNAAWLGICLGVAFGICFLTGLLSHLIQHPPGWFTWPARPAGLYRVTQGLHVATGIAAIPLLLVKLWTVYPKLFHWPPFDDAVHALERVSLLPLISGAIFLLVSGTQNIFHWYPWHFFFPVAHWWAAWITVGALIVHIGAKATQARRAIAGPAPDGPHPQPGPDGSLSRRAVLRMAFGGAGLLTLVTLGETFGPLRHLDLLSPRRPDIGPQGLPVNRSAEEAGIMAAATDPAYRLVVEGGAGGPLSLSIADLRALGLHTAVLPIACVEGWSGQAVGRGVRVRDLLAHAGRPGAAVQVGSLETSGIYTGSSLTPAQAADPDTLLALEVNGSPLHIQHGYPVRLIGPNRPGVQQTKWVGKVVIQ